MRCVGSRECGFCSWTCGLSCPQGMWDFTELATQIIKNPSAMQETRVQSLYWEDPWRRDWLPTLGILPEEPHEQRSLVGYSLWGGKESDMTKHAHARAHTHTHTHTHTQSWGFSSPTRDRNCVPCIAKRINHWTAREVSRQNL